VRPKVAIIYNEPTPGRYDAMGEEKAVLGVLDEVGAVHRALAELGYPVACVPLRPPLEQVKEILRDVEADLIFNLFEGFDGCPETEVAVAYILAELGLPYTGNPGSALELALDKPRTKAILEASGISTPQCQILSPETIPMFHLSYPCIVKPRGEDASHGISEESVVNDPASLERQVTRISELFHGRALVEEFIEGREFNATVLGNREPIVLPISEIAYSLPPVMPRLLTFAGKWEPDSMYFRCIKAICPAEIGSEVREHIVETARAVFRLLGCRGYARVDMRLDAEGRLMVLEVNPNPDISPGSGAALQAEAAGMTYNQFIERIALLALERTVTRPQIRPMTSGDKPAIMRILTATPQFKPAEVAVAEEVIDSYLKDPLGSGYHIFVAEVDSLVMGYICYGPTPLTEGTWDIYWVAVAPEEQGRGIGRALLTFAEDRIKESHGRLALIETSSKPEYVRTRRFYHGQGYEQVCHIPDFYAPGDDKLIFQKRLKGSIPASLKNPQNYTKIHII